MKAAKPLVAVSLALLVILAFNLSVAQAGGPPQPGGFFYTVRPGDTLYSISVRYNTTVWSLAQANRLFNPSMIFSGQVLVIPAGYGPVPMPQLRPAPMPGPIVHVVRHGETLFSIARMYGVNMWSVAQANCLANPSYIYTGQRLVIPLQAPSPVYNPGYNSGYNAPWYNTTPNYPTYGGNWGSGSWNGGYNPYQAQASW